MISLSQLLELAGKATKGPWRAMRDGNQYINGDANLLCGASRIEELTRPHNPWYVKPLHELESVSRFLDKDADFIAAANPETVTALVNEVIKLREALGFARKDICMYNKLSNGYPENEVVGYIDDILENSEVKP